MPVQGQMKEWIITHFWLGYRHRIKQFEIALYSRDFPYMDGMVARLYFKDPNAFQAVVDMLRCSKIIKYETTSEWVYTGSGLVDGEEVGGGCGIKGGAEELPVPPPSSEGGPPPGA